MLKTSPNSPSGLPEAMLLHWQDKLCQARQRGILHLQMPEQQGLQMAEAICQVLKLQPLWVHCEKAQSTNSIKHFIGKEHPAVVYNAYQKLSANHIALLAGTVKAGGLLVLISDTEENCVAQAKAQGLQPYFIEYWFRCIAKSPAALRFNQAINAWCWPNITMLAKACSFDAAEQQQAIADIKKTVLGKARSPLLLLVKRGRGKSAALGMAAAELAVHHNKDIIVTGPNKQATNVLEKHYQKQTQTTLAFWPIDKLLDAQPECDAIFIDEAAAMPISQLQSLAKRYNRLVFATTIDGYEGSGQGFLLHFKPFLQQQFPKWRSCYMHQAIRFANNDGLENFIDNTFLLAAEVALTAPDNQKPCLCFSEVLISEILSKTHLLAEVFALLGLAHYQTSADDLQFLLENPKARLFIATEKNVLAGVLLTVDEGGFNPEEADKLTRVPRRVPGHILPQQLLAQGYNEALTLRYCRIVRIAVLPLWRRLGVATGLLETLQKHSQVDVQGTSFSATANVLAFWQQIGFNVAVVGSNKSTASACYTVVYLKANSASSKPFVQKVVDQCQQQLAMQLLLFNQDMPAECLPWLFQAGNLTLSEAEALQVKMFCEKRLGFETAHWALAKQLQQYFQEGQPIFDEQYPVVEKLLLNTQFEILAKRYNYAGRKPIEEKIRQFFIRRLAP